MTNDLEHSPEEWQGAIQSVRIVMMVEDPTRQVFKQVPLTKDQYDDLRAWMEENVLIEDKTPDGKRFYHVPSLAKKSLGSDSFLGFRAWYPDDYDPRQHN